MSCEQVSHTVLSAPTPLVPSTPTTKSHGSQHDSKSSEPTPTPTPRPSYKQPSTPASHSPKSQTPVTPPLQSSRVVMQTSPTYSSSSYSSSSTRSSRSRSSTGKGDEEDDDVIISTGSGFTPLLPSHSPQNPSADPPVHSSPQSKESITEVTNSDEGDESTPSRLSRHLAFPLPPPFQPRPHLFQAKIDPPTRSEPQHLSDEFLSCPAPATASTFPVLEPNSEHTPNVYINGLPPNFPEDRLFALCAPFGQVRSVRTFTRHISERPTGYGFVLFDTVEAAAQCIASLRRYRNLHPSFSKQVHKIPGTPYVHPHTGSHTSDDENSTSDTFKAKMEKLQDHASTNLYIEGLPLSIDEPALATLIAPYNIKSSRFFQTKLSNPPRIIAFVRLETRGAAEEIIERLHGRMVRGWNDPGSRISVRFADTSEQRELRRQERTVREDESSPSRLTIAQAALLNMRGQQLQSPCRPRSTSLSRRRNSIQSNSSSSEVEFVQAVPVHGRQARYVPTHIGSNPRAVSPYQHQRSHPQYASGLQTGVGAGAQVHDTGVVDADCDMAILLDTLRGGGPYGEGYSEQMDYHIRSQAAAAAAAAHHLQAQAQAEVRAAARASRQELRPGIEAAYTNVQAQSAHNGYTPAEELILRAHVGAQRAMTQQQQSQRRGSSHGNRTSQVTVAGTYHSLAEPGFVQAAILPTSGSLPAMSEDEFHARARARRYDLQAHDTRSMQSLAIENYDARSAHVPSVNLGPPIHTRRPDYDHHPQQQQKFQLPVQGIVPSASTPTSFAFQRHRDEVQQKYTHTPAHIRSTTLPQLSTTSSQRHSSRDQPHSISIPPQRSLNSTSIAHSNRNSNSNNSNSNSNSNISSNINSINTGISISSNSHYTTSPESNIQIIFDHDNNTIGNRASPRITTRTLQQHAHVSNDDDESKHHHRITINGGNANMNANAKRYYADGESVTSPPLISPALTYSARTPATLSPATPFFGTFAHAGETFGGVDSSGGVGKTHAESQ